MPWIQRKKDEHRCDKPRTGSFSTVARGDRWQCPECHVVYTVEGLNDGDQRDLINPPLIVWDRGLKP